MVANNTKLFAIIALYLLAFTFSFCLLAQGAPITGIAQVDIGGAVVGQQGALSIIPLNVDLSAVTAVDESSITVPAVLANYRIAISYDNTLVKARLTAGSVQGGTTTEFLADIVANIITSGTNDTLVLMYTQLNATAPMGQINLAQIEFDVLSLTPATAALTVSVLDLRTPLIITGNPSLPVIGGELISSVVANGVINIIAAVDTDGDGLPDAWETANGLNLNNDTDALIDSDGDGLNNLNEYLNMTDPQDSDTDNDQVPDGVEVAAGTDPNDDTSFSLWITSTPVANGLESSPYQYFVVANDVGVVYSLDQAPGAMTINSASGVINWLPSVGEIGDFSITVRTTKGAESVTQNYMLTIIEKGDINADGLVNAADLLLAQRHMLNEATLDVQQIEFGDLYPAGGDGIINVQDVLLIMRKVIEP